MLVRAPIGVPSWGEARVEGRVDPRGGREGWRTCEGSHKLVYFNIYGLVNF